MGIDGNGNVYVAGYYNGTLTLDPVASGAVLTSAGSFDNFLGEYNSSGTFITALSAGGSNFDADFGIGVNSGGQVALAGRYTGPASFGSTTLPAQSNKSIFIAALSGPTSPTSPTPNAPALEAGSDAGLSNSDGITNDTTPTFDASGITAPGNLVTLLRDGVAVATRTGTGPITDPGPVPNGVHSYTLEQTVVGSNISAPSAVTSVTIDTTTPPTPTALVLNPADDSGAKGDGITNVNQPRLTGTIASSTLAQLLNSSGTVLASALAGTNGAYTLTPPSPLADGTYVFSVREESVAGNFSAASASFTLVIDTTPPDAPTTPSLLPADDSGTVGDGITNVNQPRLIGTAASSGLTIQLLNAANTVIGSATAGTGMRTR